MPWIRNIALVAMLFFSNFYVSAAAAAELVMFESKYCPYCEQWHADIGVVYHKTTEGKRAPLRRVDIDEPIPEDLKFLKVSYYTPTFILMDKGKEIARIRGYPGDEFFWFLLGEMLDKLPADSKPNS